TWPYGQGAVSVAAAARRARARSVTPASRPASATSSHPTSSMIRPSPAGRPQTPRARRSARPLTVSRDEMQLSGRALRHLDEGAAVLEQVVADGAGPQDADEQLAGRVVGAEADAHLLAEQPTRADEADAGRRQVAAEQGQLAAVLGAGLDRLDEIDAALVAALDAGLLGGAVGADEAADGAAHGGLGGLLAAERLADRADVVVAAAAAAPGPPRPGQHRPPQGRLAPPRGPPPTPPPPA